MAVMLEAVFTPAEIATLAQRDLSRTTCVVFDILRATSVFVTALASGARYVRPVAEIAEALAARSHDPSVLLAGERQGLRICAADAAGVNFDFGNSPREFTPASVRGRKIVSTTTNGTRALRACVGAERVFASSFLNLAATAGHLSRLATERVLLVCAGTGTAIALEDVLAAGALCIALREAGLKNSPSDSAQIAAQAFVRSEEHLVAALESSQNGGRLLSIPGLREDVAFCARRNVTHIVAEMDADGLLVQADGDAAGR